MTNPDYTAMALLVDRSGSMGTIRGDAEGAINAFLDDQKKEPGRATVRLSQFDDQYEEVYKDTDIQDVPKFTLNPRGMTALNDSWARLMNDFGASLAALPEDERPGHVIFVVVTDGLENASREYRREAVAKMVKHQQENYNWEFVFLAANQDAVQTGGTYNVDSGSSLTFAGGAGLVASASALSTYAGATRSGGSYRFSDEDREAAVKSN
jgi:hypothetical protein